MHASAGSETDPALAEPANRLREDAVLLDEYARGERFLRVIGHNGHGRLNDDRTAVELRGDKVHRTAVDAHAGFERAAVRVKTGERGQERRMNVQETAPIALDETVGE